MKVPGYHLIQDLSVKDELFNRRLEFIGEIISKLQVVKRDKCTGYYECYGYIGPNPIYFKAVKLRQCDRNGGVF